MRVARKWSTDTQNGDALVAAALAGQGIIYQPTFLVADALKRGQLIALALDHPPMEIPGVFALLSGRPEAAGQGARLHRFPPAAVLAATALG